jgi:hypothetical protein
MGSAGGSTAWSGAAVAKRVAERWGAKGNLGFMGAGIRKEECHATTEKAAGSPFLIRTPSTACIMISW